MSIDSSILRRLSAVAMSPEAFREVLAIMAEIEEAQELRRANEAARTALYRQRGGGNISAELRQAIFKRDGFACVYCNGTDHLQCDHVTPVSKGGETSLENLVAACRVCNAKKKDRDRKAFVRGISRDNLGQAEDIVGLSADKVAPTLDKEIPPAPPKENSTLPPSKTSKSAGDRRKPETQIAADAQPDEINFRDASSDGMSDADTRREWVQFVSHHVAKGTLFRDWHAAWRKWLASPYRKTGPPNGASPHRNGFNGTSHDVQNPRSVHAAIAKLDDAAHGRGPNPFDHTVGNAEGAAPHRLIAKG